MQSPWLEAPSISAHTDSDLHACPTDNEFVLGVFRQDPREIARNLMRPVTPVFQKTFNWSPQMIPIAKHIEEEHISEDIMTPESPVVLERPSHSRYFAPTISLF